MDGRVRQAGLLYEQAVFTGDEAPLAEADRELDAAEADLAVARGRLMHTRFMLTREHDPAAAEEDPGELPLFERAALLYRGLGELGGEAEALFWVGCFHQVIRHDNDTALPILEQSLKHPPPVKDAYIAPGEELVPLLSSVNEDERLLNVVLNAPADCFVDTQFIEGTYCVPEAHSANTKRIFGLLTQLIALQTTAADLAITPTVRVVQ